ncbi:hypothetical protein [Jannaschia sp. M317]|uniref:calcium-binding protein n=1 Tax=Jannaschia sp. M317 TaxID=2867011 RepID=UPI002201147D|nr:hypothetical protein [Jannaschia sp. M317]UWQ19641.1 hypothetical protein K3551_18260 [Jannaschia sp. M317]
MNITGDSGANDLFGSAGNDTIEGLGGDDTLTGHSGNDILRGGPGNDVFVGGAGTDRIEGGSGTADRVLYYRETGTLGIRADLQAGTILDTFGNTDTLFGIEQIYGSNNNDTLLGHSTLGDLLFGRGGNDILNGRGGDDTLIGGQGADTLNGGTGDDQIAYFLETGTRGVNVNLTSGTAIDTFGTLDTLQNIDRVLGTERADTLRGDAAGNLLFGRGGNDIIDGLGGNDTLIGGAGNDTFNGGGGDDQIAYFLETGTQGVRVDLDAGTAVDSFGGTDTLQNIDRVLGTERADTLRGANSGDDLLFGRGGNDIIDGRGGNDTLIGGAGRDTITGGVGDDQVAYFLETGTRGVSVDLGAGTATDTFGDTDQLIGVDRALGTDRADTLLGSSEDDRLFGRGGNDTINGRDGRDTLVGGAGNDTINGGDGLDQVAYFLETGTQGVNVDLRAGTATDSFGNNDRLIDVEHVFGTDQNDVLLGTDVDGDRLFGRDGNDTIDGRDGDNLIYTGAGDDVIRVGTTTFDARDTVVINGNGTKTITGTGSEGTRFGHHIVFEVDAALTVSLKDGIATTANGLRVDWTGALHFLELGGSAYDDMLTGGLVIHDELEWYVGHQGNDTIDGGTGTGDTIVYDDEVIFGQFNYELGRQEFGTHGATVNLATGVATDTFGFTDTLINIDQIRGTRYADIVIGSDEDNGFWMLGGNDVIDGGAGFDRVHYDDDTMHGGNEAVNVNLITGIATDGYGNTDRLKNIEGVFTTTKNDTVVADNADNRVFAFAGNDTVRGGGGDDVILGHEGNDTLRGDAGDDEIWGGDGNDIIDGGVGTDVARYRDDARGINANLVAGTVEDGSGGTDQLISIENLHGSDHGDLVVGNAGANQIFGYGGNDTISAGAGDDVLLGGAGNDVIRAGAGNDELRGEAGADTLDGGAGTDVARYLNAAAGVNVNLIGGQAVDGHGTIDTLTNIENVHGSGHGDTLRGNLEANQLFGFGGNDQISGGSGADTLLGGDGNDLLEGGAGNDALRGEAGGDTLDGGAGQDLARYLDADAGVNVNLGTGRAADGQGGQDTLISIEGVHGSAFGDTITGDAEANQLSGFGGNDLLVGAGGGDTLLGGDGNDTVVGSSGDDELWGEAGDDTLDGASGDDLVRYRTDARGIVADLGAGTVRDGSGGTDSLISIERLHGSDHGDAITGNAGANRLFGFDGNDTINGGNGDDVLLGGNENDSLSGGGGNDEIWGGAGDDTINGNSGTDLVRYLDALRGVDVDLTAGTAQDGMGGTDRLSELENVHGSDFGDQITGNASDNELFGFAGADTLSGAGGNDILLGGDGNDSLSGGSGNDQLRGQDGTDTLNGGSGVDLVRYRDATMAVDVDLTTGIALDGRGYVDRLISIEQAHGSDHDDRLIGTDGANQLFGYDGADTIEGGAGNDVLSGGQGGDTYRFGGGFGIDAVNDLGGSGTDRVLIEGYRSVNANVRLQGANIQLDFGYGDAITLAGSHAAGSTSTIEQVIFGDGEIWSHADLVAAIGQRAVFARLGETSENNSTYGTDADDTLNGQGGNDIVLGLGGDDNLSGGSGSDTIRGGAGDDTLNGGSGNDRLEGGTGIDHFVLAAGGGRDVIEDFEFGRDIISVAGGATTTETTDANGNRVISLADGTQVTLAGVTGTGAPSPAVAVSGAAVEDATLMAEMSGLVDLFGTSAGTVTYQWLRDGRTISGATADSYLLTQDDVGSNISVQATVGGNAIRSTATGDVENLNDRPTGILAVTGTTVEDSTLTADASAIADEDGLGTFAYQWLRDGEALAGATTDSYLLTQEDAGSLITVQLSYTDQLGTAETVLSTRTGPISNLNDAPTGTVRFTGAAVEGETLTGDATSLEDADGLGSFSYSWLRDGQAIAGADEITYTQKAADVGATITLEVSYTDEQGTREVLRSDASPEVAQGSLTLLGDGSDNTLRGGVGNDNLSGLGGNDRLLGREGSDTLNGGDGTDTLNGGDGDDFIFGGDSEADLRDIVYGGAGDDSIEGGYGNDLLNGDAGDDTIAGGFGADEVLGGDGDDVLTGAAFGDVIFGGNGADYINGGFGSDRVNGGEGADRFFHLGIADHGSDWIQDYTAAQGDVLQYGGRVTRDQFQVNTTTTVGAGADDVEEAFIIFRPTGQILWALVDGAGEDAIRLQLGQETFNILT